MARHIIDAPRSRDTQEKLGQYVRIDHDTAEAPGQQSKTLLRESRTRDTGAKLKRFAEIERRDA